MRRRLVLPAAALAAAGALTRPARACDPEEMNARLAAARAACGTGDPAEGARLAVGLARLAGRVEARAGLSLPDPFA